MNMTLYMPQSADEITKPRQDQLLKAGFKILVVSDEEYIKRFGRGSYEAIFNK